MKYSLQILFFIFVFNQFLFVAFAEDISKKNIDLPKYPQIKAEFDNQWSKAITKDQKLKVFRETIGKGRHSGRPILNNMFKNFDPEFFRLDPDLPGLDKIIKLIASDNSKKSIGHAREILYANSIESDGRFKMLSFGEERKYPNLNSPQGSSSKLITKGEADLLFIHKETGQKVRMEVKKTNLRSQRANINKYKSQIIKMAYDFRTKGEIQIFVNRHEILPELKEFAKKHGVQIAENVSSKSNAKPPTQSIDKIIDKLDKDIIRQARFSALTGLTMQASMGICFAILSANKLKNSIQNNDGSDISSFRIAKDGISFVGGLSFASGQVGNLALKNPKWENSKSLKIFSKYAGRMGIAFAALGEAFEIIEFARGYKTPREFYRGQTSIVAGVGGGAGGAYIGAVICAPIFPPFGSIVGGILFGVGGGFLGSTVADKTVDQIYYFNDQKLDKRYYTEVLKPHYNLN